MRGPIRRVLRILGAEFRRSPASLVGLVGVVVLAGAIPAATVLLLERTLNATLDGEPTRAWPWALAFSLCVCLNGVLHVGRTALVQRVSFTLAADLRRALHQRLLGRVGPGDTGARLAALTTEIDEVQFAMAGLVGLIRDPWSVLALLLTAAWLAPGLLGWAAALVPPVLLVSWLGGGLAARTSRAWIGARADLSSIAQEQLSGAQLLRAFGAEPAEARRFAALVQRDARTRVWRDAAAVLPSAATQAAIGVAVAVLLGLGAVQVAHGQLEGSSLAGFAAALALLARPAGRLTEVHSLLKRASAALEGVEAELAKGPERPAPIALGPGPLSVELRGAVVDYGERRVELPDLDLAPGSALAVVGPTGAGKTSLLRALLDEAPLGEGQVRVGGRPPQGLGGSERVAMVHQRPVLFARSIRENLTLGRRIPDEDLRVALDAAGADFVDRLPCGLETSLGESGAKLSGGEGQRLALARALCGRPGLLLLDEPTSHVDAETRDAILQSLRRLEGEVTVLCVTHDPVLAAGFARTLALGHRA